MHNQASDYFNYADHLLQSAEREMNRAEEDVVTQMVVGNARHALVHYLTGYLCQHGHEPAGLTSPESLLKQCAGLDPRFRDLDLRPFAQLGRDPHHAYAHTLSEAESFLAVAREASSLTRESITA